MALVRLLVDGYSLLHACPWLARGVPRHSAQARDELIRCLTRYRDASGTPITLVFDGGGAPPGTPKAHSTPEFEVLYSRPGQTADAIIERAVHRLLDHGEVQVVTDDRAEQETVLSLGGSVSGCDDFMLSLARTLEDFQTDIDHFNLRERRRFRRTH